MLKYVVSTLLAGCLTVSLASAQEAATSTPQTPATTPTTTAVVTPPPPNPDDAVVCRYEKVTGSLFTTRICHTMREWKQRTQDARDTMDKADERGSGQAGGS